MKVTEPYKRVKTEQFPKKILDIPYASLSPNQRLDLYLPDGEAPYPLVVLIHGGGWCMGNKRGEATASIYKIISQGYALASLEYRLSTEAVWPAPLHDVKAAIRFLRQHSAEYGLQTEHLAVWGNSAGGHLAEMLAATPDQPDLEDRSMGSPEASSRVTALISWYGVSDLLHWEEQMKKLFPALSHEEISDVSMIPKLMGFSVRQNPEAVWKASPLCYVTEDFPVCLFQHGRDDKVVPYVQSKEMVERILALAGSKRAVLEYFPGGHGTATMKTDENIIRCLRFLDCHYGMERDYDTVILPEIEIE